MSRRNTGKTVCSECITAYKSAALCQLCTLSKNSGDASFKMLYEILVDHVEDRQIHSGSITEKGCQKDKRNGEPILWEDCLIDPVKQKNARRTSYLMSTNTQKM